MAYEDKVIGIIIRMALILVLKVLTALTNRHFCLSRKKFTRFYPFLTDTHFYRRFSFAPTSILSLYLGPPLIIERQIIRMSVIEHATSPLSQFLYALKAPETKRQWPNRLKVVFGFLGLVGNLDEQAKQFMTLSKEGGTVLVQDKIIGFISYQVQRARKGETSLSTVPNYLKAMKLFCEMNDIHVSWKKISRGVPRGRQAANDRAPTREEIQRLLEYPDRRIKPIVYTMISSGIRIGAGIFLSGNMLNPFTMKGERLLPQNSLSTPKRQMNIIHSLLLKHLHH